MRGSSAPKPPDPQKTAAAQTGTNVSTAIANQVLGNVNQNTPFGSLSYDQTGSYTWVDRSNPKKPVTYELPTYTATQTLSPEQQKLLGINQQAEINLARLGRDQSAKLGDVLGKNFTLKGAPEVNDPRFQTMSNGFARGGRVRTGSEISNPDLQRQFGGRGEIAKTYGTDFSADRQRVEDALMQRMNPSLEAGRTRLETQLVNQGIGRGTEAWDRAMRDFSTQENDARLGAILSGGEEQSRMVGMERDRAMFQNSAQQQGFDQAYTRAGFANTSKLGQQQADIARMQAQNAAQAQRFGQNLAATSFNNQWAQQDFGNDQSRRQNWLNEQFAERNQPINEIAALLGTGQVQMPNFVNAGGVQMPTVDYAGIVNQGYQNQLGQWQASQNQSPWGSILNGAASLVSAKIMTSDRRLKRDVRRVGEANGLPLYEWEYVWGEPGRGHMADEAPADAVLWFGEFAMLDYGRLAA